MRPDGVKVFEARRGIAEKSEAVSWMEKKGEGRV